MICPKGLPAPLISIHAPRTGSDPTPAMNSWKAAYFNPRSPHGERRTSTERGDAIGRISIYAPRTGSDRCAVRRKTAATYFNPRSPHGERRSEDDVLHPASVFQSTLPARGATAVNLMTRKRYIISIHAPRTGRDGRQLCGRVRRGYFNPRSPHGERRCPALRPIRRRHFNPRSPHGERPAYTFRCWLLRLDFNPRSPHGERQCQPSPV